MRVEVLVQRGAVSEDLANGGNWPTVGRDNGPNLFVGREGKRRSGVADEALGKLRVEHDRVTHELPGAWTTGAHLEMEGRRGSFEVGLIFGVFGIKVDLERRVRQCQ